MTISCTACIDESRDKSFVFLLCENGSKHCSLMLSAVVYRIAVTFCRRLKLK